MTTTTLTLAAFLEARLAEDEAEARSGDGQDFVPTGYWDNTRVLAEVAAKRAIVARHSGSYGNDLACENNGVMDANDCPDMRALAAVHSDHPDYDESWRP